MTLERGLLVLGAAAAGYVLAAVFVKLSLRAPDRALVRTNVRGAEVPAVLGLPLAASGLVVLGLVSVLGALGWDPADAPRISGAVAVVTILMTAAGRYDDRRGDESARGFAGHLKAAAAGRVTGGAVKIAAGAGAGLIAGVVVADGRAILEVAALVALSANLINLTDTSPGRASKSTLLVAVPLAIFGASSWTLATAGALGALLLCTRFDLEEKAMLGDAGANPLGGVVGLGLAVSLGEVGRVVALFLVAALNLASERWSFSRVIDSSRLLARLDSWGRK